MIFFLSFSILFLFLFFPGGMHGFLSLSLYDVHLRVFIVKSIFVTNIRLKLADISREI